VLEARAQVRALRVDRVVAHWAVPCAWPIAMAAPGGDTEIEVVSHGGDVRLLAAIPRPIRDRIAGAIARRAASWRFVSAALQQTLLGALGTETRARVNGRAVVRPASIDLPDVREASERLRRELGAARVAVSVGRLVPGKRVERAIDFVAASPDVDALVVVGDGPERPRLEAYARARGVDVRFVGLVPRDRALAWMAAARVVVHASAAEGLSTVLREAAALGTPVVNIG
jgi:glycosyltransferase involved in cell wall biosynthesis